MAKLTITVEIDDKTLGYYFGPSFSNYWCRVARDESGVYDVHDFVADKHYAFRKSDLVEGLQRLAQISPYQFGQILQGKGDMWTTDALFQATVLGEILYA